jgi:hypothetical protein
VKYWEIIIKNLRNAGWNCGSMATTDGKGRAIWVVAAERSDAGRFIVNGDQELTAFLKLESASIQNRNGDCDRDAISEFALTKLRESLRQIGVNCE